MENVETIIKELIFGGEITLPDILVIITAIYGIVMGFLGWRSKVKLIKADIQLSSTEKKVTNLCTEFDLLKLGLKYVGDIICTAYLANPNVDEATKKKIALYTTKLEETTHLKLEPVTTQLVDIVTNYVPQTNTVAKQENITAEAQATEKELDTATESVSDVINKLEV